MKKLILHRETLRLLSSSNLRTAYGANSGVSACQYCESDAMTVCNGTFTCPTEPIMVKQRASNARS